jgi:hypothetical protein
LLQFLATTTYRRSRNETVDPVFVHFWPFVSCIKWGKASTKSIMQHWRYFIKKWSN